MNTGPPTGGGYGFDSRSSHSANDPFGASGSSPWAMPDPATSGRSPGRGKRQRPLWPILIVAGCVIFFVCAGLLTAGVLGLRNLVQSDAPVTLTPRERTASDDRDAFADLTSGANWPTHPRQTQIESWLKREIQRAQDQVLTLDPAMFYEAVVKSPQGAQINSFARLQLKESLKLATPQPDVSQFYNLLAVRPGPVPGTAELYIVFYGDESLAELSIWFVAQDGGGWLLYDCSETDLGRRFSDEWANFFQHPLHDHAGGYDRVVELINRASLQFADGESERATALLRRAELVEMLDADRDRALVQIGWAYQRQNNWEDSKRVFNRIRRKDDVPGAWASTGINQVEESQWDAAIESADHLRQLFGRHPSADFVTGRALEAKGEDAAAADHFLRCLQLCPNDGTTFYSAVSLAQDDQLEQLVRAVLRSERAEQWYLSLLDWHATAENYQKLKNILAQQSKVPEGWVDYLIAMERVEEEEKDGVSLFHRIASKSGASEELKERARGRWLQGRLSGDEPEKLAEEADDLGELLREILDEVFYDELYVEAESVLALINDLPPRHRERAEAHALVGWSEYQQSNYAEALHALDKALAGLDDLVQIGDGSADEGSQEEDEAYLRDQIEWYVFDSLLETKDFLAAWRRFGEQLQFAVRLGRHLSSPIYEQSQEEILGQLTDARERNEIFLRAYLKAHRFAIAGRADFSESYWRSCLLLSTLFTDEDAYLRDQLASDYGRHTVRHGRVPELLSETSQPYWEAVVTGACDEVVNLHDDTLARRLHDQIVATSQPAGEESAKEMLAALADADHRWKDAIEYHQVLYRLASEEEWHYSLYSRRKNLLNAYLRDKRFAEARKLLQESDASANPEMEATLLLATSQFPQADAVLEDMAPYQRGYWLFGQLVRPWVFENPAAVTDLIGDREIQLVHLDTPWSAVLLQSADTTLDTSSLRSRLQPVFDGEFEVVPFGSDRLTEGRQQWMVSTTDGFACVVATGTTRWEAYRHGTSFDEMLPPQKSFIAIEIVHSSQPFRRWSMDLLAALADEETFAVCDQDRSYLWFKNGQPWSKRLKWSDRVPFDNQTISDAYLSMAPRKSEASSEGSTGVRNLEPTVPAEEPVSVGMERLRRLAKTAPEESRDDSVLIARIQLSTQTASEWLPVRVMSYDNAEDSATVRLLDSSLLFSPLRNGSTLLVSGFEVMEPRP